MTTPTQQLIDHLRDARDTEIARSKASFAFGFFFGALHGAIVCAALIVFFPTLMIAIGALLPK